MGLNNYLNVLSGDAVGAFWGTLVRTLIWTFCCVFFHYTIGLGLALLLNRQVRGRAFYRVLLILPWAVPAFISAFAWKYMFNAQYGIINQSCAPSACRPGAGSASPDWALVAVIIVNVWLGVPFMMVALLGGLQSIPGDLYEAAEVDGATPWQRFRQRDAARPAVGRPARWSCSGIIWTFNMFAIIYLIAGGRTRTAGSWSPTRSSGSSPARPRLLAVASTYGVLILSVLLVFAGRLPARAAQAGRGVVMTVEPLVVQVTSRRRALDRPLPPRVRQRSALASVGAARHADRGVDDRGVPGLLGARDVVQAGRPADRDDAEAGQRVLLDNYTRSCPARRATSSPGSATPC